MDQSHETQTAFPGHDTPDAHREKRLVALTSVVAAVLLTSMKLTVGVATGSLGILSEAAHSGLDLVAAAVTLWAVKASSRPADTVHTYGHGKFENLSALFETLLLLSTCVWIVWEAISRLFFEDVHVQVTAWSFAIMVISIVVDWSRSRALLRVARKYGSQALEADALHFSTDIWSSLVVIGGLGFVLLGENNGVPWLAKADCVAALAVAGIVIWISMQLGRKSIDDLLDAVPPGTQEAVARAAEGVAGVLDVKQTRVRRAGPETFVDITLTVGRTAHIERAHAIADAAEGAIRNVVRGADVVVHVEPVSAGDEGLYSTLRLAAARRGLGIHGIRVFTRPGALAAERVVEAHLEVPDALTLRQAHDEANAFEASVRDELHDVSHIVTHLDPAGDSRAPPTGAFEDAAAIRAEVDAFASRSPVPWRTLDVELYRVLGEPSVAVTCALPGTMAIVDAHALTDDLEKALRKAFPELGRVVVHAEPS